MSPRLWTTKAHQGRNSSLAVLAHTPSRSRDNSRHKLTILAQTQRGRRKYGHANLPKRLENQKIGARPNGESLSSPPSAGASNDSIAQRSQTRWLRAIPSSASLSQSGNIASAGPTLKTLRQPRPLNQTFNEGKAAVGHITTNSAAPRAAFPHITTDLMQIRDPSLTAAFSPGG